MSQKKYRTCVRMSAKEYAALWKKSKAAGLSMNKYMTQQLRENRPQCHREAEMRRLLDELNNAGKIINGVAKDFNSGIGSENQLEEVKVQLLAAIEKVHAVREMGYPYVE